MLDFIANVSKPAMVISYPSNLLHKSSNYKTMFDKVDLPYNRQYNNCKGQFCYTYSKGTTIYKQHTDVGMVGRTTAGYIAQRKRV